MNKPFHPLVSTMMKMCSRTLSQGHDVAPQFTVLTKDNKIETLEITMDDERVIARNMMRAASVVTEAVFGVFVSEGWEVTVREGAKGQIVPPSEAEDRIEVLLIVQYDGNGSSSISLPIRRGSGGRFICLDDTKAEFVPSDGGAIAGAIPPAADYSKFRMHVPALKFYLKTHGVGLGD